MNPRWRWDRSEQKWRVFYAGHFWWIRNSADAWQFFLRDVRYINTIPALTRRLQ